MANKTKRLLNGLSERLLSSEIVAMKRLTAREATAQKSFQAVGVMEKVSWQTEVIQLILSIHALLL